MYDMCRYEQAWQVDRTSPWCAVSFKKSQKYKSKY